MGPISEMESVSIIRAAAVRGWTGYEVIGAYANVAGAASGKRGV